MLNAVEDQRNIIENLQAENEDLKKQINFLHKEYEIPSELMKIPYPEYDKLQRYIAELHNAKKKAIRTALIDLSVRHSMGSL